MSEVVPTEPVMRDVPADPLVRAAPPEVVAAERIAREAPADERLAPPPPPPARRRVRSTITGGRTWRQAFVLLEVLGPPVSLRPRRDTERWS